jgi:hypothetical protein
MRLAYPLLAATFFLAFSAPAAAEYTQLDPVPISRTLEKIPLTITVTPEIEIVTKPEEIQLRARAVADLSDVQAKAKTILHLFELPKDNCDSYGRNVVVSRINSASLVGEANVASIRANARVRVWECQKGLPVVTVKWKTKCIVKNPVGRGCLTKTKVPVSVSVPGQSMVKAVLVEDDVDVRLDFELKVTDGKTTTLSPAKVSISPNGTLEKFLVAVAKFFDVSAEKMAREKLESLIEDGTLRKTLPEEWQRHDPRISEATFSTAASGALLLRVGFEAKLSGKDASEFLKRTAED